MKRERKRGARIKGKRQSQIGREGEKMNRFDGSFITINTHNFQT